MDDFFVNYVRLYDAGLLVPYQTAAVEFCHRVGLFPYEASQDALGTPHWVIQAARMYELETRLTVMKEHGRPV